MKVITTNREVIYSNACGCSGADGYSNVDGKSGSKVILAFQKFANSKGFRDSSGKPLIEDGKWGRNTNQAAAVFGSEFDALVASDGIPELSRRQAGEIKDTRPATKPALGKKDEPKKSTLDTITGLFSKDETNPPVSDIKNTEDEKAAKKKKMIKIALVAGGLIALGAIIIAISKHKK